MIRTVKQFAMMLVLLTTALALGSKSGGIRTASGAGTHRCAAEVAYAVFTAVMTDEQLLLQTGYAFAIEAYSPLDCSATCSAVVGPEIGEALVTANVAFASTNSLSPEADNHALIAIDNRTGEPIWTRNQESSSYILTVSAGTVTALEKGHIIGRIADDGTALWGRPVPASRELLVISGKSVIFVMNQVYSQLPIDQVRDQEVISIDAQSGHMNWGHQVLLYELFHVLGVVNGAIFASDYEDERTVVTARDIATGCPIWKQEFDN